MDTSRANFREFLRTSHQKCNIFRGQYHADTKQEISRKLRNGWVEVGTHSGGCVRFCHVLVMCHIPMKNFSHARSWPVWAANERMRSLRPEWGPSEKRLGSALLNEELRHPQGIWGRAAASWCLREHIELVCVSDLDAWEMTSSSGLLSTSIWMNDQESLVHWCILVILKSLHGRAGK